MKTGIAAYRDIIKRSASLLIATVVATHVNYVQASDFSVSSPTFNSSTPLPQTHVLNGFGCSGENRSPALSWHNAPNGTKSYAITMYDPDAPTGSGWWHWVVFDIPAWADGVSENAGSTTAQHLPNGAIQGRTDFGSQGYGGPCPPQGTGPHKYVLTVYALKVEKLPVPPDASAAMVGFMINANRLGSAAIEVNFGR